MARRGSLHNLAQSTPSPGGLGAREFFRLGALLLMAAILTFVVLFGFESHGGVAQPPPSETRANSPSTPGALDIVGAVAPWNPPTGRLNKIIKQRTRTERLVSYPAAINLLAPLVFERPHVHFLMDESFKGVGFYRLVRGQGLKQLLDPAWSPKLRAQPVELQGILKTWSAVDPRRAFDLDPAFLQHKTWDPAQKKAVTAMRPLFAGTLDVEGRAVDFLLLGKNVHPLRHLGERYKVRGVFYRLRDDLRKVHVGGKTEERYITIPVILAKRLSHMVPLTLRDRLPDDLWGRTFDAVSATALPPPPQQDPTFYELLGYVLGHKGQIPRKGDQVALLSGRAPLQDPGRFREDLGKSQGQITRFVEVRGQIVYVNWESFEYQDMREGDAPSLGFWHVVVSDAAPARNVPSSLLIPWAKLPPVVRVGSVVRCTGIYYRVHAFRNRGRRLTRMPLVVAVADPVDDQVQFASDSPSLIMWVLGAAVAGMVLLFFVLSRERNQAARFQEALRGRRSLRQRGGGLDLNKVAQSVRRANEEP